MLETMQLVLDIIGTLAFAVSGAMLGIRKGMDIFGVNILAVTTAVGGGCIRDLLIGDTPPVMFRSPRFVLIALLAANLVFLVAYFHHRRFQTGLVKVYETILFWFDTLGLAAFTVDGVLIGLRYEGFNGLFLQVFLGVITGIGGGILRDVLAQETPAVFVKHIYAVASLVGALTAALFSRIMDDNLSLIIGFFATFVLRTLAASYRWNLPRIGERD